MWNSSAIYYTQASRVNIVGITSAVEDVFIFISLTTLTIQIRDAGLMSIKTEFLFMIADTTLEPSWHLGDASEDHKILMELEKSLNGENVAFIYNSSTSASTCNVRFK